MPGTSFTIEQILSLLQETPPRIAASTRGLCPDQLRAAPQAGEGSANEVLAHLRACADPWSGCIVAMIEKDATTLRAINPRTWIKQTDYLEQEFRHSLGAYTRQRAALLALLESLPQKGWSRRATVTGAGKPRERTVYTYAQWLANHEHSHFKQTERIVNTRHRQQ